MGCDYNIETSWAQRNTRLQRDVLHGKTVPGVLTELTVLAIGYHLVRLVMCQSATRQPIGVARSSFLDAWRWLGAPSAGIPLEGLIGHPTRPYRGEPRVKKRRPKPFPLRITPRQVLRQPLGQQAPGG
jgi:hypothetical protein